jgi:hypothetical protein
MDLVAERYAGVIQSQKSWHEAADVPRVAGAVFWATTVETQESEDVAAITGTVEEAKEARDVG